MASRYYGMNRGDNETAIAEGSSTNSKAIELVIDLTKSLTKAEVIQAIKMLTNYLIKGNWPPA